MEVRCSPKPSVSIYIHAFEKFYKERASLPHRGQHAKSRSLAFERHFKFVQIHSLNRILYHDRFIFLFIHVSHHPLRMANFVDSSFSNQMTKNTLHSS